MVMYSTQSFLLLAAAQAALAQTFVNFVPAVASPLVVEYGNGTSSTFVSPAERSMPAGSVSQLPNIGLMGTTFNTAITENNPARINAAATKHMVVMVDPDFKPYDNQDKTTLLHWLQTDFNASQASGNYSRLIDPHTVYAHAPYLAPNPPSGQIHRYVVMLYEQPASFSTADVATALKRMKILGSNSNRAGFNVATFQMLTGVSAPIAATSFQFGSGSLVQGSGMNFAGANGTSGSPSRSAGERNKVGWSVLGAGVAATVLLVV